MSNRARSDIRTFASGIRIHPDARIVYVRALCSTYVKIVLIMKDDGIADEDVCWTCLPSTQEQSERFKFDVHISSIISSYMSRIMPKNVFRVSEQIRTNGTVQCTL